MTPTELKYNVEQSRDSFFFTRETMRFFGDTMRNYGVRDGGSTFSHLETVTYNYGTEEDGIPVDIIEERYTEVWELYRKHPVKHGLNSSAYFDKKTFRRVFIS